MRLIYNAIKSVRKSNNELKKQLDAAKKDLKYLENSLNDQESIHIRKDGGHQPIAETTKSLYFLSDEYDDFNNELPRIGKLLKRLEEQVEEVCQTVDELQEYRSTLQCKSFGSARAKFRELSRNVEDVCGFIQGDGGRCLDYRYRYSS